MTEDRNWREAKPKWVVDAAEAEIGELRRKLALRWPTESRPQPLPFRWGEYDRPIGAVPNHCTFYRAERLSYGIVHIAKIELVEAANWRYKFIRDGSVSYLPPRGNLFATRKEALLEALWDACEDATKLLKPIWEDYENA